MSKLYSIGELLIDFQSVGSGSLKQTKQFVKNAGGAPANVCVQAVKLGQQAVYLTKVGNDGFGEFLIETLRDEGVNISHIKKTDKYDTSLAFVSFTDGGEREFSFYRRAAADLHFTPDDFCDVTFLRGDLLEFGSVALKTDEAKATHKYLIDKAKAAGARICFDPNLRFNLWESSDELRATVLQFLAYADIVKVGDDELEFITGQPLEYAVKTLFKGALQMLFVTFGEKGAKLYLKDKVFSCDGYKVKTVDTTGAGDSFFGAAISQLMDETKQIDYQELLNFACKSGAYTTMGYGAIPAMGNKEKIEKAVR